jgi:hypothetical protein
LPGRSRKRGRHAPPTAPPAGAPAPTPRTAPGPRRAGPRELPSHLPPPRESRSEVRNAEIRAALRPYAPGERPRVIIASVVIAAALAFVEVILWLLGVKVGGNRPAAVDVFLFFAVFLACAIGLWQMRSGAVLGFMSIMAIISILFTLFLIEASNIPSAVIALAIIGVSGYLFFKLVRVLSRLQMPRES